MMRMRILAALLGSGMLLAGCGQQGPAAAPVNASQDEDTKGPTAPAGNATGGQEASNEAGSGTYAADCAAGQRFVIELKKNAEGFVGARVTTGGKTYDDLLTSYSFMGKATPADFLVAIIFSPGNSPVVTPASDGPRIEIWKGEAAFHARINGDKAQRLDICPPA